jgi:Protein of unknown function (DUF993)
VSKVNVVLPDTEPVQLDDQRWAKIASTLGPDVHAPVRLVYAAAHIVMNESYADVAHTPEQPGHAREIASHVNWEATDAVRRHLASQGFGIAEAMDTAQRFEVGWAVALNLIERCGRLNLPTGFVAGAGTDHLAEIRSTRDLIEGTIHQCRVIAGAGGIPIILPMPWLSLNACSEEAYVEVYRSIIDEADGPMLVHWLGPMFLASLEGYFPGDSFARIMRLNPDKVRGAKLSMLDANLEIRLRAMLAQQDQIMLTGDDFHFADLIAGDASHKSERTRWTQVGARRVGIGPFSHGLLGVFDAIAEPAGLALRCLAAGRPTDYERIMTPCEQLGRTLFESPTAHYKVGLAFLAWLNGLQDNPMLANHLETVRRRSHLCEVVRRANEAGAIRDAQTAAARLARWAAG